MENIDKDKYILTNNMSESFKSKLPFDAKCGMIVAIEGFKNTDLNQDDEFFLFKDPDKLTTEYFEGDNPKFLGKIRSQMFVSEEMDEHSYFIIQKHKLNP